jgi:hypothetical protein
MNFGLQFSIFLLPDAEDAEWRYFSLAVERSAREKIHSPSGGWVHSRYLSPYLKLLGLRPEISSNLKVLVARHGKIRIINTRTMSLADGLFAFRRLSGKQKSKPLPATCPPLPSVCRWACSRSNARHSQ